MKIEEHSKYSNLMLEFKSMKGYMRGYWEDGYIVGRHVLCMHWN